MRHKTWVSIVPSTQQLIAEAEVEDTIPKRWIIFIHSLLSRRNDSPAGRGISGIPRIAELKRSWLAMVKPGNLTWGPCITYQYSTTIQRTRDHEAQSPASSCSCGGKVRMYSVCSWNTDKKSRMLGEGERGLRLSIWRAVAGTVGYGCEISVRALPWWPVIMDEHRRPIW